MASHTPNSKLSTTSDSRSKSFCDSTTTSATTNLIQHPLKLRSHTTFDHSHHIDNSLRYGNSSGSGIHHHTGTNHHWNIDDLSYVTHMQRVRARANFARQISGNCSCGSTSSSEMYRRRRESIAAMNFPVHLTSSSGTGLNIFWMNSSK